MTYKTVKINHSQKEYKMFIFKYKNEEVKE